MLAAIVKSDIKGTVLDQAERAWAARDYEQLSTAARRAADQCSSQSFIVQPLVIMSKLLATNPEYLPQAVTAARDAANYAPENSDLENTAFTTWQQHLETLPTPAGQVLAVESVLKDFQIRRESRLYREAGSEWDKCVARAEPGEQVKIAATVFRNAQLSNIWPQAVAVLLRNVEKLKNSADRVDAALTAAWYSESGSENYQQAVSAWENQVLSLESSVARFGAIKHAASRTNRKSDLYRRVVSVWQKHMELLPAGEARVTEAMNSDFLDNLKRAAVIILDNIDAASSPELRVKAARRAYYWAEGDAKLQGRAANAFTKHLDALPDLSQRLEEASHAASADGPMKAIGVAAILRHIDQEPNQQTQTRAASIAIRNSQEGSPAEQQAVAAWSKSVRRNENPELRLEAATGSHFHRRAASLAEAAIILDEAHTVADVTKRVKLVRSAMWSAGKGSPDAQRAVKMLLAELAGLPPDFSKIELAKDAALYAAEGSPLEAEAVSAWADEVAAWRGFQPTERRIGAALTAIHDAPHASALAKKAVQVWKHNVAELKDPAAGFRHANEAVRRAMNPELFALARTIIFSYIETRPSTEERVEAARAASWGVTSKGIKAEATAAWSRHMESVDDPGTALTAIKNASFTLGFDSDLDNYAFRQTARDAWPAFVARKPQKERLGIALAAVRSLEKPSPLKDRALAVWEAEVKAPSDPLARIAAAKSGLGPHMPVAYPLELILEQLPFLSVPAQRVENALYVLSGGDRVLNRSGGDRFIRAKAAKAWTQAVESIPEATARLNAAAEARRTPSLGNEIAQQAAGIIMKGVGDVESLPARVGYLEAALELAEPGNAANRIQHSLTALKEGFARPSQKAADAFVEKFSFA